MSSKVASKASKELRPAALAAVRGAGFGGFAGQTKEPRGGELDGKLTGEKGVSGVRGSGSSSKSRARRGWKDVRMRRGAAGARDRVGRSGDGASWRTQDAAGMSVARGSRSSMILGA